jgi:hypothetical protein
MEMNTDSEIGVKVLAVQDSGINVVELLSFELFQ